MAVSYQGQTRGETMLALRRRRMAAAPAWLRGGFRPFFLAAAAWAPVALALWVASLAGTVELPTGFEPLAWHRHEMLFGFVGAGIAGFLLTAIPNWTGRLPIAGAPLLAIVGLWLIARMAVLLSAILGDFPAALLDVGFYLLLGLLAGREVIAAKNRNLPIVLLLLLFGAANLLDHLARAGLIADRDLGTRCAIALVLMMISLIGGRIIPSFTRNWLAKQGVTQRLPGQPGRYDAGTILLTGLALLVWVVVPSSSLAGGLFIAAGLVQAGRLARWRGLSTLREPLVAILHIGYAWLPAGLLLLGASKLGAPLPASAALHALTAGAMATMLLAVMTRATLGHTGRELSANLPTVLLYLLVTAGALLRVVAPLGWIDYTLGMRVSALAWGGAFLIFLLAYGPVLMRPHASDKER